jgi:hypothetical protein
LGPDGLPDQVIKNGLKQPNQIKISFTVGGKEMTSSVVPGQAHFGPEFFLLQTLPYFETKIVLCLSANNQQDRPTMYLP